MKKIALIAVLTLAAGFAAPHLGGADQAKLEFSVPSFENPFYRVLGAFAIEKGTSLIKSLDLNGARPTSVLILKSGKPVDFAKPLGPGVYEIALDHAWRSGKTYTLTVVYEDDTRSPSQAQKAAANAKATPPKDRKAVWTAAAPATGGIPEGYEEGFHSVFAVEEPAGIERTGELVALTVTAPKDEIGEDPLAVVDAGQSLACQVMERKENQPSAAVASAYPVTTTVKLIVPVKAAAHERKLLVVLKGGPPTVPGAGPAVSGEGLGRTVRSSRIVLGLDSQSGQLATIEFLKEKLRLHNEKQGDIHGNPDVSVPGQLWDHASDWNPPAAVAEKNGPLVYTNARKGPMSKIQDVFLEVKYTLEQDAPYLLTESRMTVRKDLGVIAVRNDQMVFAKRFFDTLVYKDPKDGLVQRPLLETPDKPFGFVQAAPAEAEWIGLVNTFNRYGFFGIRLAALDSSLGAAGTFSHRAGTCFYAPAEAEFVYWVRPLLSTWGEHSTSKHLLYLPEGSEFYEKNAYILLAMDEGTPAVLDGLARRLKNPLRVY
jgi:hypothetical protein